MIHVGRIARQLRETLGLTQQEIAEALGVTNVHISKIETEKSFPSQQLIDRYREEFGVDLYVYAWCQQGDVEKLPDAIRKPVADLARAWEQRFGEIVERHRKTRG
jgi:transcriptional regulator with XRE-family HTH domain